MVTGDIETERKYEAESAVALLPSLADLPQVTAETGEEEQGLDAEYYDTPDLRLLRAGVTLRRRYGGTDEGWHLKLPVGPDSRREIRRPIGEPGSVIPDDLARLVRAYTRGAPLGPVAHISTARRRRTLEDEQGTVLAEVVLDDVSAQTLGRATAISRWQEAEVELAAGDRRLLDEADRRLRQAGFRPAGYAAKLERALADRLPAPDGRRRPARGSAAGDVVLGYLRGQAAALKGFDAAVRLGEPDSVHQMRVTCRRLRAALQSFGAVLARERTSHLNDELRWLGRELAGARDAEVLADRFRARLQELPPELILGPVAARVQAHFAPIKGDAQRALLEALDSDRYLALLDELEQVLDDPPLTAAASLPGADVLPHAVAGAYWRVSRRMRRARRAGGEDGDVALHEARKAAKRARYAAEAVRPVSGKNAKRFARQMKKLQSVLGDHQDRVVARRCARELGAQALLAGENGFTFGLLYERECITAQRLRDEALRVWKQASAAKYRRWLR